MLAWIRSWLSRDADLKEELRFHIEARTDDLVARGMGRAEAARTARIEFGSRDRYTEECRDSRGMRWLRELAADVRYALRVLRKAPGFTAMVVVSLGLGIGANSAMFSVVNGVLLRPLPFRDYERVVSVAEEIPQQVFGSMKSFRALPLVGVLWHREELQSFEDMAALQFANYQLIDVPEPEELAGGWVTVNLCDFLGIQPVAGRCFTAADDDAGAQVTMLSFGLWQRQFGGDPQAVGRSIAMADFQGPKRFTVIGVLPPRFQFVHKVDVVMPLAQSPNYRQRNTSWTPSVLLARMKPGIASGQARAELAALQRRMYPKQHEGAGGRRMAVAPVAEYMAQNVRTGLLVLLGVVGLVLLITCANVANLILSRDAGRVREMAVRASLGAGRARLWRQLLTESAVLAALGGAMGLLGAQWIVRGVKALAFARLPRVDEIAIDGHVLVFTVAVSIVSGIVFGAMPALRLSRVALGDAMKRGGTGSMGSKEQQRVMSGLVVFEVALCTVAMIAAGLLVNTFVRLKGIDPGFRVERLLAASLNAPKGSAQAAVEFYDAVLERARSIPGVEAAGLTSVPPPYHVRSIVDFRRAGTADGYGQGGLRANERVVSAGYFRAMGIRLVRGRDFGEREAANGRRAIVISESMAKHCWPGEDAVGRTIYLREFRGEIAADVIGVAGDVRQTGLRDVPEDQIYLSYTQAAAPGEMLMIRTAGNPAGVMEAVKREVRAVDRNQTLRVLKTMDALMADEVAEPRFYVTILSAYGLLALVLTTVGVGGVVSYGVSRRTREIGLRMSFGATPGSVVRMFAAGNLKLIGGGLAIGAGCSWGVTRYARSLLYEVTPQDPATMVAVVVLFAAIATAVSVGAARRAAGIDPARVLRDL